MKTFLILIFAGSLLTNAWLWQRRQLSRDPEVAPAKRSLAAVTPSPASALEKTARAVTKALATSDPALLRDELKATGADAATVRALVESGLKRRYEEQASAWRIERIRTTWWRGPATAAGDASAPSARALWQDPLQALLGPDPLDLSDAEIRYDFLPPEKRRLLAKIELDYTDLIARQDRSMNSNKSDSDRYELLVQERKKDIEAALNPEESAEYELRSSSVVSENVQRFAAMEATESEFRAIAPLALAFNEQAKTLRAGDPNFATARAELEQRTMDQLVAALGYERALDYCWAVSSGPYVPTVRVLKESQLPTARAAQLLQLAAETGIQGAAVHRDDTLTVEQKRSALAALQTAVRPQLDALVPSTVQPKLPAEALAWFNVLGDGRYAPVRTVSVSNGWYVPTPVSVSTPPRTPVQPVPLPRRMGQQ